MDLTFSLDRTDHCATLPDDFATVVEQKGDRFRDDFTRFCLYLASKNITVGDASLETVVVGTEYGNLDAMLRLQRAVMAGEPPVSAQQFPHSTTSSASTFLNLGNGITGGNITLNSGALTPVFALLQALLHVNSVRGGGAHVMVGDVYCAEAVEDVAKKAANRSVHDGVTYFNVRDGKTHRAEFHFGDLAGETDASFSDAADAEWNRALLTHRFLIAVSELAVGEKAALALSSGERSATVTVRRVLA
ncbi:hypothetical protein [Amycolatopsis sp. NPDC052450]|uniref:hypothetical protein n=1 Tax=Amycolatopsis sp. NPDC052450 TaxID=3363937 RepID=UPI0037CA78E2